RSQCTSNPSSARRSTSNSPMARSSSMSSSFSKALPSRVDRSLRFLYSKHNLKFRLNVFMSHSHESSWHLYCGHSRFPCGEIHPQGKVPAASGSRRGLTEGGDTMLYQAPMAEELNPTPQGWCI